MRYMWIGNKLLILPDAVWRKTDVSRLIFANFENNS